jgi:hypothetical protein
MTDVYADGFAQDWAMIVGFYFVANTENYNIRVNFSFIYDSVQRFYSTRDHFGPFACIKWVSAKDFLSIFRVWLISEHHQIDQRCTLKILQLIN